MEIINRNFFRFLSSGAFGCECDIEPMSQFKWQQTIAAAYLLGVTPYLAKGIVAHEGDSGMNLSGDMMDMIRREAAKADSRITLVSMHVRDKYVMPHLANVMNNIRLKRIVYGEYHSIDTSVTTLNMLEIIIKNINGMMGGGVDMYGLIQLGLFLRQRGQNVDFVKMDTWLGKLGMKRMANLIGSMLILLFGFEDDEIPFVNNKDGKAKDIIKMYMDKAKNTVGSRRAEDMAAVDDELRPKVSIACRGMGYFRYMPAEAVCRTVSDFTRRLSEIEE